MPPKKRTKKTVVKKSTVKKASSKKKVMDRTTKKGTVTKKKMSKKTTKKTPVKKELPVQDELDTLVGQAVDEPKKEERDFTLKELDTEKTSIEIIGEDDDETEEYENALGPDLEGKKIIEDEDGEDTLDILDDEEDEEIEEEVVSPEIVEKKSASKKKSFFGRKKKIVKDIENQEDEEDTETNFDEEEDEDIDTQLTQIYENGDGSMPDMHTFEKRPRGRVIRALFILIIALVFFAVVAWVGLFIIQPKTHFSEEDVILSISGDEEVKAGQEVTYRVRYRNSQGVALNDAILELRYPSGFQFVTSSIEPSNENHDMWKLGNIDPQGGDFIDVTGRMYGDLGQKQSLRAFLNYAPANFSSQFQKVTHVEIVTNESILVVGVELPDEISLSSEIPVVITLTPEEEIKYIRVSCEGDIFVAKKEADPIMDEGEDCAWSFDTLSEEQTITFNGSFVSKDMLDSSSFVVTVRGWDDEQHEGEGYILAQVDTEVIFVQKSTSLNLAINGGISSITAQPGEALNASIIVKNSGETVLEDVEVRMIWDAPSYQNRSLLSWPEIDIPDDGDIFGEQVSEIVRRGVITWDSRYIPELAEVMPGEEIKINMMIPIRDNIQTTLANFESAIIKAMAEIRYGGGDEPEIMSSNEIMIDIVSDLDLEVRDEIGEDVDGPLHTLTWLLSNSFHELKDIVVEADIYGDVVLSADDFVVPAGELSYDEDTQHMTWTIDQIPVGLDVLAAQFQVVLMEENPSQSHLVSKVKVSAYDTVTQQTIHVLGDEILLQTVLE